MTPTPPSPEDDILDLIGLDPEPAKAKVSAMESDFEKELEALFAEDLTEPVLKAPAPSQVPADGEEVLLLEDLVLEPAAAAPASAQDDEVLDLGAFAAPEPALVQDEEVLDLSAFAAPAAAADDEDVLDLSVFAAGGELDITPPEDAPGGKDGGIDSAALDDLISGLGEPKAAEPVTVDHPLDGTDMSDLLETLEVPRAAPLSRPADEMLDLSLGDLVEGMPAAAPLAAPAPAPPAAGLPDLDLTLPDLSDPEPMTLHGEDMGGDLNLSLADSGAAQPDAELDQLLGADALDLDGMMTGGMMEGLVAPAEEPVAEQSLDPAALLDQLDDVPPAAGAAVEAEPAPDAGRGLLDGISLGDAALGAAAVGAAALGVKAFASAGAASAAPAAAEPPRPAAFAPAQPLSAESRREAAPVAVSGLQELQEKLSALATQVTGGSVAVVRLEGQLAQRDQAIAALEQRLQVSRDESHVLRRELSDLRAQLEETLRQRAQADEKAAMAIKERLALVEDRQIQIDRDVRTEIERAVPREAARVIREEIAAMAASMHEE